MTKVIKYLFVQGDLKEMMSFRYLKEGDAMQSGQRRNTGKICLKAKFIQNVPTTNF